MPDLYYCQAYGPMHARGSWSAYLEADSEAEARLLAEAEAPKGYDVERVHRQVEPPAPVLKDCRILNSTFTLGAWWAAHKAQKPEVTAAGQARLF